MDNTRRLLLLRSIPVVALSVAAAAGLLRPGRVLASNYRKPAFELRTVPETLKALGFGPLEKSANITIKAPDIAENGANVFVEMSTDLPAVDNVVVLAEKNPRPLVADFALARGALPVMSLRIKMAQTANVRIIVRSGGRLYTAAKEVKVTIGGCGAGA